MQDCHITLCSAKKIDVIFVNPLIKSLFSWIKTLTFPLKKQSLKGSQDSASKQGERKLSPGSPPLETSHTITMT